jgi:RNA polymerase sigma factor (sigma-70 family)
VALPQHDAERRFAALFDEHRRAVLGYALRRVADPADAADVVAETFLTAWRRLDDVPGGGAALPWLLGVARRVLANQRRGARRHAGLAERLAGELATQLGAPPESDLGLRAALARLPERDRELLLLAAWEELTPSQIAMVTGLRGVTVRSRLHRARRRLRAELERDAPHTTYDLAKEQL